MQEHRREQAAPAARVVERYGQVTESSNVSSLQNSGTKPLPKSALKPVQHGSSDLVAQLTEQQETIKELEEMNDVRSNNESLFLNVRCSGSICIVIRFAAQRLGHACVHVCFDVHKHAAHGMQILETKTRKLEQLVRLKDAKIDTLAAKLHAAGLSSNI